MAKKTTAAKEQRQPSQAAPDGSIDQVRELLFGEQARRAESRFAELENKLEALFSKLEERLQHSSNEQVDDTKKLRGELREFRQDTENHLASAEDEWAAQLKETDKTLRAELKNLQLDTQKTTAALSHDKVGRTQLAELLNNLAAQLVQDDFD